MAVEWTQDDIDRLKAAIASGILTVTYDGPPRRTVTYQTMTEMRRALAEMNHHVSQAPTLRKAQFSKGFR